jgi:hypothetical protein
VQVAGRDPAGGGRDRGQWAQHPAGHEPAEGEGKSGDDRQCGGGLDQHLPQVAPGYLLRQHRRQLARASLRAGIHDGSAGQLPQAAAEVRRIDRPLYQHVGDR